MHRADGGGGIDSATAFDNASMEVPGWVLGTSTAFVVVNDPDATASTLGVVVNSANGTCFGFNDSVPGWYTTCEFGGTPAIPLHGVFQRMYTSGVGGSLRGVEWDDATCPCGTTTCPVVLEITGVRGTGAIIEVSADGSYTVYAGGYGFTFNTPVWSNTGCTGRAITSRVWYQPINGADFDIETGNLEAVNLTERTTRFGSGTTFRTTHTLPTLSFPAYVMVALPAMLNVFGVIAHVALIFYKKRLVTETVRRYKQD